MQNRVSRVGSESSPSQQRQPLSHHNQTQPGPEFLNKPWVKTAIQITAPFTIAGSLLYAYEGFQQVVEGVISGDQFLILTGLAQTSKYLVFCVAAAFVWKNQTANEAADHPSQHQLNAMAQQNPVRRIDDTQQDVSTTEWNASRKRITILLMMLASLGIGQTIKGLITNNDQLVSDGVYRSLKTFGYTLIAGGLLIATQQRHQPQRRMH